MPNSFKSASSAASAESALRRRCLLCTGRCAVESALSLCVGPSCVVPSEVDASP